MELFQTLVQMPNGLGWLSLGMGTWQNEPVMLVIDPNRNQILIHNSRTGASHVVDVYSSFPGLQIKSTFVNNFMVARDLAIVDLATSKIDISKLQTKALTDAITWFAVRAVRRLFACSVFVAGPKLSAAMLAFDGNSGNAGKAAAGLAPSIKKWESQSPEPDEYITFASALVVALVLDRLN